MKSPHCTSLSCIDKIILGCFDIILQRFHQCFHFQIVTPVSIEIGRQMSGMSLRKMARVSLKEGELGVALGNGRPLASIRVQILVKTTVNDKRQKARIPATKLQWLPARHAILTSGSGRTLDGRESLRAGRDAQLLPCRPAVRYPGPNAHTGPDGRTSVNQPLAEPFVTVLAHGNRVTEFIAMIARMLNSAMTALTRSQWTASLSI